MKREDRTLWITLISLVISYNDLCDQLSHTELGDGQQFYNYICQNLNAAARCRSVYDETGNESNEFIEKVFRLVDHLDTNDTRFYAFHAWIRVAATVFRPELRSRSDSAHYAAAEANSKVLQRIEGCINQDSAERKAIGPASRPVYWDFTSANQKLQSAWKEGCNFTRTKCWHRQNRQLIEYIYKRAYGEIRAKVMLTIGTKVPTELAEKIFEFTMAAEKIPLDANIYEEEIVSVPGHMRHHYGGKAIRLIQKVRGQQYCHYSDELLKDALA